MANFDHVCLNGRTSRCLSTCTETLISLHLVQKCLLHIVYDYCSRWWCSISIFLLPSLVFFSSSSFFKVYWLKRVVKGFTFVSSHMKSQSLFCVCHILISQNSKQQSSSALKPARQCSVSSLPWPAVCRQSYSRGVPTLPCCQIWLFLLPVPNGSLPLNQLHFRPFHYVYE